MQATKGSWWDSDDYFTVLWMLILFTLVVMAIGIGFRSPWPADEPRFVEVAREMVDSGRWLFPTRGGEFYPDKPPVFMWSIALFYSLTDNLKLAFLLPNALCGLLTVVLTYDLGARLWNVRTGRNAALLLMLVPQFLMQAKNAQIDAMVACWIMLGIYGLLRHFALGPNWRWFFIGWAFMGLGVITKGVGFLPALMLLPLGWLGWQAHKGKITIPAHTWGWKVWLGPVAMLAVIACWLVPMVLAVTADGSPQAQAYMNNILFKQTGERYVNAWHHHKPWYFFVVEVVPWLWFPASLLLLAYWREIGQKLRQDPWVLTLLVWVVLVIVFFSISPGKRNVYILPALPALCLAIAASISGLPVKAWVDKLIGGLLWALGALVLLAGVLTWFELPAIVRKLADYTEETAPVALLFITLGLVWLVLLWLLRQQGALLRAGMVSLLAWLLVGTWGYLLLDTMRTPKALMAQVAERIGPDGQLGLVDFKEQFILFSPIDITHFSYLAPVDEQARNAWQWMHAPHQGVRYILLPENDNLPCFDMSQAQVVGQAHRRLWLLLPQQAMLAECDAPKTEAVFHTRINAVVM
ncbi:ArnT family glycosyltransferase [Shewanella sp. GXUN23E]|uniref:ArnT family glycosyltransferase n=1 Tax=Shewanella sp. GXUN23E TaxID=3422498 RepID=UPI003D7CDF56